jgi:hypothetical protein
MAHQISTQQSTYVLVAKKTASPLSTSEPGQMELVVSGLPSGWFAESTDGVGHHVRELTGRDIRLPYSFHECGLCAEACAVMLVGIEYADWEPQFSPNDSNGLDKIGIICHKYGNFELALEPIA